MPANICLFTLLATLALAGDTKTDLPPRYKYGLAGATFLYSIENGGISTPPNQYENVYIQAIDGELVFTQKPPTRTCPCSDSFGAKNFTGYYVGGTDEVPTLQLFTSGSGAQYVYVAEDLSIRYTAPGDSIPSGANGTSISIFVPAPNGGGEPTAGEANIQGYVTASNGTRIYYNGYQFCAASDSPPRTQDGVGPLSISATPAEGNTPDGSGVVSKHCISGFIVNSINDTEAGPYDITYRTPTEPLVSAYTN